MCPTLRRWYLSIALCLLCIVPVSADSVLAPGYMVPLIAGTVNTPTHIARKPISAATRTAPRATIQVTYTGFTPEAQAAFQYAVDIWATQVSSSVPITINATWSALGGNILGSCGPTSAYPSAAFTGAPYANTYYPIALANAIAGRDLDTSQADINATFNSGFSAWYFGTDGNTPYGKYDFASVVLHELGHGLGFVTSMTVQSGLGKWGSGTGKPFVYDRFVVNGSGQQLVNTALFANSSAALATQFTSDNLFLNGPATVAAAGGNNPRLYAPATWSQGSSISHLDEATYPAGNPNSLMTPVLNPAESIHDPGPITLGVMTDMGWQVTSVMPDLQIRASGDSAFLGVQVYNVASQQRTQTVGSGQTASFDLKVVNDGRSSDTITLTAPVGGNGWTVRYFDALTGGTEITMAITGTAGWSTGVLASGASRLLRVEVTPAATVAINATVNVNISATSATDGTKSDTVTASATRVSTLASLALQCSQPSPQVVGTAITLTAVPNNSGSYAYKFRVGYKSGTTWIWRVLRDYTADPTCTWTPDEAQTYTVVAYAREANSTVSYQVYKSISFSIKNAPLSGVTLATNLSTTSAPAYSAMLLSAAATGGTAPEYKFRVGHYVNGVWAWSVLREYSATETCLWKPTVAGRYSLVVWAREQGSAAAYQVYRSLTFTVTDPAPISGVSVLTAVASPQPTKTSISVTALPTGGLTPEYMFRLGYKENGVWVWSVLRDYSTTATYTWRPTVARTYSVVIWAREQGSTAAYQVYGAKTFTITP